MTETQGWIVVAAALLAAVGTWVRALVALDDHIRENRIRKAMARDRVIA